MSFKEIMTKEIGRLPFDKSKTIAIPSRFFKKAVLVGTLLTLGFATTIVAEGSKSGATIVRNQEDVSAPTGNGINSSTLYGTISDEAHERRKIRKQREKTEEERKASETEEVETSKPKPRYLEYLDKLPKSGQIPDEIEIPQQQGIVIIKGQTAPAPTGNGINSVVLHGTMSDEASEQHKALKAVP